LLPALLSAHLSVALPDAPPQLAARRGLAPTAALAPQHGDAVARSADAGCGPWLCRAVAARMTDLPAVERIAAVPEAEAEIEIRAVEDRFVERPDLGQQLPPHHEARQGDEILGEQCARKL